MLEEHCEFNSPYDCYVLLAVSRKKCTPSITNSQEIVFREVIKSEENIRKKYLKVKAMCESYRDEDGKSYPFYLYVSLNARDSLKATFALMSKINLWLEETVRGVDRSQFFKKVYGHFYSTLMHKESKSRYTKYFMFDFDIKDKEILGSFLTLLEKHTEVSMVIESKNGYHIKVKPFNAEPIRDVLEEQEEIIELKRDANLFVEYISTTEDKTEYEFSCWKCGAEFIPLESSYPCGPCPEKWKCKSCGAEISPCCGAKIIEQVCDEDCELCDYCGPEICELCGEHCHCGGCV